jgi:DNA-3-methyladenine glycosylase I
MKSDRHRCEWALSSQLEADYHDREWGVPVEDDRKLFEMLILEGAQAGLSWRTVLAKREAYRRAFDDFDAGKVASYSKHKVARLRQDPSIIRNRLKIEAAVVNAGRFLEVQQQQGSFRAYLWGFTAGRSITNRWTRAREVPVRTPESDALSMDLKRRGFKFVGTTICYAYMQSIGMVNDHLLCCFRHREIARLVAAA